MGGPERNIFLSNRGFALVSVRCGPLWSVIGVEPWILLWIELVCVHIAKPVVLRIGYHHCGIIIYYPLFCFWQLLHTLPMIVVAKSKVYGATFPLSARATIGSNVIATKILAMLNS